MKGRRPFKAGETVYVTEDSLIYGVMEATVSEDYNPEESPFVELYEEAHPHDTLYIREDYVFRWASAAEADFERMKQVELDRLMRKFEIVKARPAWEVEPA